MALYRVRVGQRLPRHGEVHAEGTLIDIEPHVAAEPGVASRVEAVPDESPAVVVVAPTPKPVKADKVKDAPAKQSTAQQE